MNLKQLKHLVEQGESETVEFKKSTAQLFAAFETICAFLNNNGGTILIGVTNDGKIIGQQVSDKTKQDIATEIAKLVPPAQAKITVDYIQAEQWRTVIALVVQAGNHVPYAYDDRPYQRTQSSTFRMPQHRYEQLIVERGQLNHAWEEKLAVVYSIDSLDHAEIKRTIERGVRKNRIPFEALDESIEDILLHRLALMTEDGVLTNAALVLFAKGELSAYPQFQIKMARFRGVENTDDFIDSQHFSGNAFQILRAADHFVMRHLPVASFFDEDKYERRDKPTLPILALREAFINAICHRDYSERSATIFLSIFDDRLELWNNGELPSKLKMSDLKKTHKSYPRNAKIAKVFYVRGLIETWGKGIEKMVALCKENKIPEPVFNEYSGGLGVEFRFVEPVGVSAIKFNPDTKLSPRQKGILAIIKKQETASIKQIISQLDNPPTQRAVQKDLLVLKTIGAIHSEGRGKATVWRV